MLLGEGRIKCSNEKINAHSKTEWIVCASGIISVMHIANNNKIIKIQQISFI